jgi:V8-like Glu-specific endopeptidase
MAAALRTSGGRQAAGKPGRRVRQLIRQPPPAPRAPGPGAGTAGRGLSWTRGGPVAAATGKVFFTLGGQDYVCSGTLVGGRHPDVVLTAAHCVDGGPRPGRAAQWATNWVFVPGYRDGQLPYGEYTAHRFFAAPGWSGPQGGTEPYDVAFVQVTAATLDGAAGPVTAPSGLPAEFTAGQDAPVPARAYVFGYPAETPYTGLYPNFCAGLAAAAAGGSVRIACVMTAGDSGGPWLAGFSPRTGTGRVYAVSTYKLSGSQRLLYGAVLGPQARALYLRALSTAR